MKTVRILLFIFSIVIFNLTQAQVLKLSAGFGDTRIDHDWYESTRNDEMKFKPSFHIGGIIDFPVVNNISIKTGAIFQQKGFTRYNYDSYDEFPSSPYSFYEFKLDLNYYYLDFPFQIKYNYLFKNVMLYAQAGPYFSVGLWGDFTEEINNSLEYSKERMKLEIGSKDSDWLKRNDYGLTFGAGIEIKSIEIGINYVIGLMNITPSHEALSWKNRQLKLLVEIPILLMNKKS